MKKYSVSQLKKFNADPAAWAGSYILNIKSPGNPTAFAVGNMIEDYLTSGEDNYQRLLGFTTTEVYEALEKYDITIKNLEGLKTIEGEKQCFIKGNIGKHYLVGYMDVLQGDTIIDIKTSHHLSKPGGKPTMRSGLTKFDEYELQLWFYMKATGKRLAQIVEVAKYNYKNKGEGESRQVIDFNRTDEMDAKRTNWSNHLLREMDALHNKFKIKG